MKATLLARTKEVRDDDFERDIANWRWGMNAIIEVARGSSALRAARLEVRGLIERNDENAISVPYETVGILLPLAQVS